MNILSNIYNLSAILGIGFIIVIMILTISSYRDEKSKNRNTTHFMMSLIVEGLIILFLLHMLFNTSKSTKSVLGGLEIL
jgi:hypothetical protein